ncbi:hypothetical protein BDZ89DRAFT_255271 [Hymenopellis radicata]|nr:hypothetical protein BDZ89DRAFT_255271 [Hymenopellis radicata]
MLLNSSLTEQGPKRGRRQTLWRAYPRTKHEVTWLRGAWPTNANGVVQFTSKPLHLQNTQNLTGCAGIFPGYYTGRATHITPKWTALPNGTFDAGRLSHVGQFFFDDEINSVVDKMHPYTTNPLKDRTRNWHDSLNIFKDSHGPRASTTPPSDSSSSGMSSRRVSLDSSPWVLTAAPAWTTGGRAKMLLMCKV